MKASFPRRHRRASARVMKKSSSARAVYRDKSRVRVHPRDVFNFVDQSIGTDLHAKRILSLSKATTGVIHSASLGVSAIGRALALAQRTDPKHGIKQVRSAAFERRDRSARALRIVGSVRSFVAH